MRDLEHALASLSTLDRKRYLVACVGSSLKRRIYRRRSFGVVVGLDVCKIESRRVAGALKKRSVGARTVARPGFVRSSPERMLSLGDISRAPVGRKRRRNLDVKRFRFKLVLMELVCEGEESRSTARDVGLKPVVAPSKRNRRKPWTYNKNCKHGNEVERCFRRSEGFRRIATRCDKLDAMFLASLNFVTIAILLKR